MAVGVLLKPIQHRTSLYILIPSQIAKLISATKKTQFILTLKQDGKNQLIYEQMVGYAEKEKRRGS